MAVDRQVGRNGNKRSIGSKSYTSYRWHARSRMGRIIFVGTVGVDQQRNHSPGYYGAKASLHAIVRTLAMELQGAGVTVNMFNPGMIATEEVKAMLTKAAEKRSIPTDWKSVENWASNEYFPNLTSRIATPEDIGRVVSFQQASILGISMERVLQ